MLPSAEAGAAAPLKNGFVGWGGQERRWKTTVQAAGHRLDCEHVSNALEGAVLEGADAKIRLHLVIN